MKRKGYVIGILIFVLVLLTGCINIPLGDGNKLKVSKDGIQFTDADGKKTDISLDESGIDITDSEGGEHSISLDEESGTISFKGEGEDGDAEWTFGEGVDLPTDFPDQIPLMDDALVAHSYKVGNMMSIMYASMLDTMEVNEVYAAFIKQNGSNVESSELTYEAGTLYMYTAEMSFGKISITISPGDENETGSIVGIEVDTSSE